MKNSVVLNSNYLTCPFVYEMNACIIKIFMTGGGGEKSYLIKRKFLIYFI